jgi:hypothetical protein
MNEVILNVWGSRERGIVVDIDVLSCGPWDVKLMFKGFSGVLCDLLGSWGDVRFRMMVCVL